MNSGRAANRQNPFHDAILDDENQQMASSHDDSHEPDHGGGRQSNPRVSGIFPVIGHAATME